VFRLFKCHYCKTDIKHMDITEQLIKLYFMYKGIRVYRYIDI